MFEKIKQKAEKYIQQSDALEAWEKNGQPSKTEDTTIHNNNNRKKRDRGTVPDRLGPEVEQYGNRRRGPRSGLYQQFGEYTPPEKAPRENPNGDPQLW